MPTTKQVISTIISIVTIIFLIVEKNDPIASPAETEEPDTFSSLKLLISVFLIELSASDNKAVHYYVQQAENK